MQTQPCTKQALYLVVVLAMALCVPWLGRPFHTRGEPREALVAQAMLTTGNWISPPAYDGAVPSKPPFSHWLIALVSLPGGEVTELTSRLPSALAFVVFTAAFFLFVAKRIGVQAALGASLILLSSSEWFRGASTCRVDTILACSMAGALLSLYGWWEKGFRGIPYIAGVLLVCSALTKGPVGIVLPLGIFSFFVWSQRDFKIGAIPSIASRTLMLCVFATFVVSIWYVLGYIERGDEFLDKIRYENFERFTSTMQDEPHKHGVAYLVGMLAIGLLPWTILLVIAGIQAVIHRSNFKGHSVGAWWRGLPDILKFSVIAAGSIILFFCVPSSKRSVYLLPAYPFLAILVESCLRSKLEGVHRMLSLVCVCVAVLAIVISGLALLISSFPFHSVWSSWLASFGSVPSMTMLAVSAVLIISVPRGELRQTQNIPMQALGVAVIGAVFVVSLCVYDAVAQRLSVKTWLSSTEFLAAVKPDQRDQLYSYGSEAYAASFYLKKPFFGAPSSLDAGAAIFVEQRKVEDLKKFLTSPIREIARYSNGLEKTSRDLVVVQVEK